MITLNVIKALKPCKSRLNNYTKFYVDKSFTVNQFMGLKNITHWDKLWVGFRMMPEGSHRPAAADIAELVLHIPQDQADEKGKN